MFSHANEEATVYRDGVIDSDVLLLALAFDSDWVSRQVLEHFGVGRELISDRIRGNEIPPSEEGIQGMRLSKGALRALDNADEAAESLGEEFVGSAALLLGLVKEKVGTSGEIFSEQGMSFERVMEEVERLLASR